MITLTTDFSPKSTQTMSEWNNMSQVIPVEAKNFYPRILYPSKVRKIKM